MLRFSIIIPTYNRCSILPACIKALRDQIYASDLYEIIVVDNNSADETAKVIAELNKQPGKKIRYIFEDNPGLVFARHAGARAAGGEILAYIDDDILVTTEWLGQLDKAYQEFDTDCAGGRILIQWDREPPEWVKSYEGVLGQLDYGPLAFRLEPNQFINGGNFSIKKKRLFQIGGFNPDQVGGFLIGDGETGLCRKIYQAGWKIVWVPGALVWHKQILETNGSLNDLKRRFRNNGISDAYNNYRETKWSNRRLLRQMMNIAIDVLILEILSVKNFLAQNAAYYETELTKAYLGAQVSYYLRLACDMKLREYALINDWINEIRR